MTGGGSNTAHAAAAAARSNETATTTSKPRVSCPSSTHPRLLLTSPAAMPSSSYNESSSTCPHVCVYVCVCVKINYSPFCECMCAQHAQTTTSTREGNTRGSMRAVCTSCVRELCVRYGVHADAGAEYVGATRPRGPRARRVRSRRRPAPQLPPPPQPTHARTCPAAATSTPSAASSAARDASSSGSACAAAMRSLGFMAWPSCVCVCGEQTRVRQGEQERA